VKDRLIELNKTINWKPESTGTGRFGNWLENLVDWNLSRSRYWGTPLPIWRTQDRTEEICIGSIAELKAEIDKAVAAEIMTHNPYANGEKVDLHRPYVDDIFLVSPSGQPMYREPDLIDVWFDSGAVPYAQWHYPFENQEVFAKNFPADFIAEGVDQTRGWFFTLHALAVMLEDSVAFKNVIANGLVLDKNGNKMSKRLGNAVDPFETIAKYGPDATRWYMISNAPPWDNLKFDQAGITEVQRRFFGTLFNTYSFFALYANLDGFQVGASPVPVAERTELDRWILSKLQSLLAEVRGHYDSYDPTKAARAIQDFVTDQLSNWYVRLSRRRFWKGELTTDKQAAYETLYECLSTVAQLMAPIAPFFADWLYGNLTQQTAAGVAIDPVQLAVEDQTTEGLIASPSQAGQVAASVHLTYLAEANTSLIDKALEERMELAQRISSLTHSLRKKSVLKVRQPLQRILVPVLNDTTKEQVGKVEDLICAEVNVKHVEFLDDTSGVLVKSVKPNFKRLGQVYGPRLKAVGARIQTLSSDELSQLEKQGELAVEVEGETLTLHLDEVEIRTQDLPGWLVATDGPLTVALDVTLTEELRQEGLARELVNRLQNLRKDTGLEVQDRISVHLAASAPAELQAAVASFGDYIREEVQAQRLDFVPEVIGGAVLEFDDFQVPAKVEVVTA
jgi:isoleucyl-tRNA synthetase